MNEQVEPGALEFASARSLGWMSPADEEWHKLRATGVTGSDIAPILGLSPYDSGFSVWHRKRRLMLEGSVAEVPETEAMRWGTIMEPVIADHYARLHPRLRVLEAPMYGALGPRAWQLASPDRILVDTETGERSVLEIKTASRADAWRYGPPGHYQAQGMWYLDVLQLKRAVIAVLIGGNDYREYELTYEPKAAQMMRETAERFFESLYGGEPPPVDGHRATYDTVKTLAAGADGADAELSRDEAVDYMTAMAMLNAAQERATQARARVLERIGDGRRAVYGELTVATRAVREDGSTHSLQPGPDLSQIGVA